jgi:hypothetical protein
MLTAAEPSLASRLMAGVYGPIAANLLLPKCFEAAFTFLLVAIRTARFQCVTRFPRFCHGRGREFESRRPRHLFQYSYGVTVF